MRVLVLGSGGREHALAWGLARSPGVEEVICAPGNDGIAADVRTAALDLANGTAAVALAREERCDLVVVGPEGPLAAGLADRFTEAGIPVFGPSGLAARLESSKSFAKGFMASQGIPTASYRVFDDPDAAETHVSEAARPLVIKADGLASGKGVRVCEGADDAREALREIMRERRFGASGARVVIEERLVGEEVSFHALCDGEHAVALATAQDFKRVLDGDHGENTGGMGTYSPAAASTPEIEQRVMERVVRPVLAGMRALGHPYHGVLYAGLMICQGEPYVIEFNVRFGDPETQSLLMRLDSPLAPLLMACARGDLSRVEAPRFGAAAVCVVAASDGYPRSFAQGFAIDGIEEADRLEGVKVFHAGTKREGARWRTAGGRVLGITARADTLRAARERAYAAAQIVRFKGMHYRRDIAERATRT
jgi:phosphoribosylamine---glycine ligase